MKNLFLQFMVFGIFSSGFSQNTLFQKTFGTPGTDLGKKVIQTFDGGYIVLGQTNSSSTYLVKMDSAGNQSWSRSYSFPYTSAVIQTKDGGYLMCCRGSLVKTNALGMISWMETYQDISLFTSVIETLDGNGYAAIGLGGGLYIDLPMLIKTNLTGTLKWSNTLNESLINQGVPNAVVQLRSDSCFYVVGDYRYGGIYAALLLTKVSKRGKGIWNKTVAPANISSQWSGNNISSKIRETYNGHLLMNVTSSYTDLLEVDTSCAVVKVTGYSISIQDWDLSRPKNDNSIYITALVGSYTGNLDILVARSDASGATQWAETFGSILDDFPSAIMTSKDRGPVVAGTSRNFSFGSNDVYIIKTDSAGTASCNYSLNSSVTTSLSTASVSVVPLAFDSIYAPMQQPANFTSFNPADTAYDACVCVPPRAGFNIDPNLSVISDSSTWASGWYWTFGNGQTSTSPNVGNPFFASPSGTYIVTLIVTNSCGADTISKSYVYNPVGIKKEAGISEFSLYPNPADQYVILNSSHALGNIVIYNSLGETVLNIKSRDTRQYVDVSDLLKGVYIVYADGKFIKLLKE